MNLLTNVARAREITHMQSNNHRLQWKAIGKKPNSMCLYVRVCMRMCEEKMRLSLHTHFFFLSDTIIFNVKNILWCLHAYRICVIIYVAFCNLSFNSVNCNINYFIKERVLPIIKIVHYYLVHRVLCCNSLSRQLSCLNTFERIDAPLWEYEEKIRSR